MMINGVSIQCILSCVYGYPNSVIVTVIASFFNQNRLRAKLQFHKLTLMMMYVAK